MSINPYDTPTTEAAVVATKPSRWRFIPALSSGIIGFLATMPLLLASVGMLTVAGESGDDITSEATPLFACYFAIGLLFLFAAWAYFRERYHWGLLSNVAAVAFFACVVYALSLGS